MSKRLRATLLHIVYSKLRKIAIVFIFFPHFHRYKFYYIACHILPCVAPVCEGMHYHKTGVPWQTNSIFIIVLFLLVLPRNALFCKGFQRFVKCVILLASWQNRARWSKLLRAVSSKIGSKTR